MGPQGSWKTQNLKIDFLLDHNIKCNGYNQNK